MIPDGKENGAIFGGSEENESHRWRHIYIFVTYLTCSSYYQVPLTCSSADRDMLPALLEAVQVYVPLWRYPILLIMRTLIRVPSMVVVIEGSDDIISPFSDQCIFKGSSPFFTKQDSCVLSPSFIESYPKENGTSSGGSAIEVRRFCNKVFKV